MAATVAMVAITVILAALLYALVSGIMVEEPTTPECDNLCECVESCDDFHMAYLHSEETETYSTCFCWDGEKSVKLW